MKSINCVFLCFVIISSGFAKLAPDYIHPCDAKDWKTCLVKSTQEAIPDFVKGIPSLGVPSLDPFVIEKLTIPLSGINVSFYQGKVTGFRKCIVDNVISELEKRHFVLEFHCNLTIKGQYEAVGRILLFPIDGKGDAKIKLTNLHMKMDINTDYVKDKEGVDHFALRNYKYTFDYGDRIFFDLKNLFRESKELTFGKHRCSAFQSLAARIRKDEAKRFVRKGGKSMTKGWSAPDLLIDRRRNGDTVLAFLNDNWKTVAEEFGRPIVDYIVGLSIKTIGKFFLAVPYNEIVHVPLPENYT